MTGQVPFNIYIYIKRSGMPLPMPMQTQHWCQLVSQTMQDILPYCYSPLRKLTHLTASWIDITATYNIERSEQQLQNKA